MKAAHGILISQKRSSRKTRVGVVSPWSMDIIESKMTWKKKIGREKIDFLTRFDFSLKIQELRLANGYCCPIKASKFNVIIMTILSNVKSSNILALVISLTIKNKQERKNLNILLCIHKNNISFKMFFVKYILSFDCFYLQCLPNVNQW